MKETNTQDHSQPTQIEALYKGWQNSPEGQECMRNVVCELSPDQLPCIKAFAEMLDHASKPLLVQILRCLRHATQLEPGSQLATVAFVHIFNGPEGDRPTPKSWQTLPTHERIFWALMWLRQLNVVAHEYK